MFIAAKQIPRVVRAVPSLIPCLALMSLAFPAAAQPCGPQWLPGEGVPGTDGIVYATISWDPDGPGPQAPRLVVGGSFALAGKAAANGIAMYDPATGVWSSLDSGVGGIAPIVYAFAVLANGDLIASGSFTTAGGAPANNIARWNGSAWSPLGLGLGGGSPTKVSSLAVLPNGDVVAGGAFSTAGVVSANSIARWDGSTWSPLGSGMNGPVGAVAVLPSGDLVAGGNFTTAGETPVNSIASWNGSAWSTLGLGIDGLVSAFVVLPSGDLVASGSFLRSGAVQANNIARWDGSAWSPLGEGVGSFQTSVQSLALTPSGDLVAGGWIYTAGFTVVALVYRWDGSAWSLLGSENDSAVLAVAVLPNGDVIAGGRFTTMYTDGGPTASVPHIARWDGSAWSALGSGTDGGIGAFALLPNGDLVAGGRFTTIEGVPANDIARWDGSGWSPLGAGIDDAVLALAVMPNGDLVAGGQFYSAGDVVSHSIARWDGSAWSALGTGTNGRVFALAVMPNGDLIAGGQFTTAGGTPIAHIARWNGSQWFPLGSGMTGGGGYPPKVDSLAVLPNGDLVAGGQFWGAGGVSVYNIARWNGSAWSPVGMGLSGDSADVFAMTVMPNGDLIAGGRFTTAILASANYIARWNGSAWSPMGSGMNNQVYALAALPGGGVVASGFFTTAGGTPASGIARWDGAAWSPLGAGLGGTAFPAASALAVMPTGELAAGGNFMTAGGTISARFARYSFTGIPTMSAQPMSQVITADETVTLSAVPSIGFAGVSVQWLRDGAPIIDGPGGASPDGGTVSGASGSLPSPTDGTPAVLTIVGAQPSDSGAYTAEFSNGCGGVSSDVADVIVHPSCPADLDSDGVVDFTDYLAFLNLFDAGDPAADLTGDGVVDFGDYLEFLNHFNSGC